MSVLWFLLGGAVASVSVLVAFVWWLRDYKPMGY
jgi:hypothetical protein